MPKVIIQINERECSICFFILQKLMTKLLELKGDNLT